MKITRQQLMELVSNEVDSLDPKIREGFFDYLKGAGSEVGSKMASTGKSVANAVKDKAVAAKNKVGQVAGDISAAGASASLQADIAAASQQTGLQIQNSMKTFKDLLARAQSMGMDTEEQEIKKELQALKTYQQTAAGKVGVPTGADVSDTTPVDTGTSGTETWGDVGKQVPNAVDMAPKASPADVSMAPKASPKPVYLPPDPPFDWKSSKKSSTQPTSQSLNTPSIPKPKPRGTASEPFGNKSPSDMTPIKTTQKSAPWSGLKDTPKVGSKAPPKGKKAPEVKTKLSPSVVKQAIADAGGDYTAAAKKLKISKDKMIQALGSK